MALIINTNIKNDADGYLIDASSVKVGEGLMLDEALAEKQGAITVDEEITEGSTNPVSSGAVYSAIGNISALLATI
ncbi:MAG: hypothetical protein IJP67_01500 [Oscillospiraceae bacterium]|nr:hypothetical protein [Oscillospiraceae bacterium]